MTPKTNPRPVTLWLFTCCGMIVFMAILGAITRLTQSGLSITDWNPIMGAIPPLDNESWQKAFSAYQQIPQYQILNHSMTLDAFKSIYFWEWFHRLWGRLIGAAFAIPLIVFLIQKKINKSTGVKFALIFVLGGMQGFIGWFMVQSGLSVRTSVSPYRLALHLGFALLIYSVLLWTALNGIPQKDSTDNLSASCKKHGWVALAFLAVTMTWGAFVAGLHAGEVFNTWPLMEGDFFPLGGLTLQPLWYNFFENTGATQFLHRWLAPTTMIVLLSWVWRCWRTVDAVGKKWLIALAVMAVGQGVLGIATILSHADIAVATIHQAGAITLLTLLLINLHRLTQKFVSS